MKANELMIGDWVGRVFDDRRIIEDCRQVDWIRTGEIGMRYLKVWSIGCIEPIPLTSEILEKNGFDSFRSYHDRIIRNILLSYYWNEYRITIQLFNHSPWIELAQVRFVHELQHALRLCGLNDLADNFKV